MKREDWGMDDKYAQKVTQRAYTLLLKGSDPADHA
jgi:hypothetical protein